VPRGREFMNEMKTTELGLLEGTSFEPELPPILLG
jgi:hypothetical protein